MANAPAASQALAVLQLLARLTEPVPASALARDLDLPRASVYHLLTVLCDQGFVVCLADEQRYGLGVAAFELGSAYTRQAPLQRFARQLLVHLLDATRHNAHLAVLHGRDVLYVIEERAPGRPPLVTDVGVRLPSQLTASGLVMLVSLPPQQVRALFPSHDAFVQRHGVGPTTLPGLRVVLSRVRRDGFALEDGTVTPDFASVAAPVRDPSGHPVGEVAVTYPAAEVSIDQRQAIIEQVVRTATDLTRRVRGRT
jgi:DNA-binding IclR family transcriptional regulator